MRKQQGKIKIAKLARQYRRKLSIRRKIYGTAELPRICVNRTNKHIFVQVIDDLGGKTLFTSQTYGKSAVQGATCNIDGGKLVGADVAAKMKKGKIEQAVFDRAGLRYTGVVAAIADTMRENGIKI